MSRHPEHAQRFTAALMVIGLCVFFSACDSQPPVVIDRRWTADAIPGFLEAAREFAHDTDFQSFFDAHHDFYAYSEANLRSTLKDTNMLPWFQDFFSYQPDGFVIILFLSVSLSKKRTRRSCSG